MANGWIPFYVADFVADTLDLSPAEIGMYMLLTAHYYQTRKPLDASASVLHRICRCTNDADKDAVARVIARFFVFQVDSYHQSRIDKELLKQSEIRGKRTKAAEVRWKVANANASDLHMHVHTQSQSQSQKKKEPSAPQPKTDPRFKEAIESIKKYWDFKNPGAPFIWDASEGKQLKRLLEASPQLTLVQIQLCLQHRARSDVAHTERPRRWLENLLNYANGPLDKFGKPKELGDGQTKTESRQRQGFNAIGEALAKRTGTSDGGYPKALPKPAVDP